MKTCQMKSDPHVSYLQDPNKNNLKQSLGLLGPTPANSDQVVSIAMNSGASTQWLTGMTADYQKVKKNFF